MSRAQIPAPKRASYSSVLTYIGTLLDEREVEFLSLVEVEGQFIARARKLDSRDFDLVTVNEAPYDAPGTGGKYCRLLSAIGHWLDQRGATDVMITEGEHYVAVGGRAPIPTSTEGYIMGPFEELLLPEEIDALMQSTRR